MSDDGFIVIQRKLTGWKYHDFPEAMTLWMHILLMANWKEGYFKGEKVERGSFITSVASLQKMTGISSNNTVRKWLSRFEKEGMITRKATNCFTVISVVKYGFYQDKDFEGAQPTAQPTAQLGAQPTAQLGAQPTAQLGAQPTAQLGAQLGAQPTAQLGAQLGAHNRTKKQEKQSNKEIINTYTVTLRPSDAPAGAEIVDPTDLWFKQFWNLYPKKVGKKPTQQKFKKCCKSEKDYAQIMSALRSQIDAKFSHTDMQYIPNPLTWLNQERYKDETIVSTKKNYQEKMRDLYEQTGNNEDSYVDPFDLSAKQRD